MNNRFPSPGYTCDWPVATNADGVPLLHQTAYYMPEQIYEQFKGILDNATCEAAEPRDFSYYDDNFTAKYTAWKERNKYKGFFSPGYRNNDTVNSMLAWAAVHQRYWEHGEPILLEHENESFDFMGWMEWAKEHCHEDDWEDVEAKAYVVLPYMATYIYNPADYFIATDYISWLFDKEEWDEACSHWETPVIPETREFTKRKKD